MSRGRPKKVIDQKMFENLCSLQCTLSDIAGVFDCCEDTIETWCKRTYKENFSDVYKKHSVKGKVSLRKSQFDLAKKNASMAIWLGKQYLGQSDTVNVVGQVSDETKAAVKSLIDMNIDMNIDTAEAE